MTAKTYPKRRLPLIGNVVPRKAKRQRRDANTAFGEPLSLRGGSISSPIQQDDDQQGNDQQEEIQQEEVQDNESQNNETYIEFKGSYSRRTVPPKDREVLREGMKAWELLQHSIPPNVIDQVVVPAFQDPDGKNSVRNMSTVLMVASESVSAKLQPGAQGLEDDYGTFVKQTDIFDLVYYLTSVIVWMAANRTIYERLGFEKIYWKAKLWRYIWRYNALATLFITSTRPSRERDALYGKDAEASLMGSMNTIVDHIDTIISVRLQIREEMKVDLPPSPPKPQTDTIEEEEPESLTPGKRAPTSKKEIFETTVGDGKKNDESPGTPSKKQPISGNREFGSGTGFIKPKTILRPYDPFPSLAILRSYCQVSAEEDSASPMDITSESKVPGSGSKEPEPEEPEPKKPEPKKPKSVEPDGDDEFVDPASLDPEALKQYNEWKSGMDPAYVAEYFPEKTVVVPNQVKWLLQRKAKKDGDDENTGRPFWPAPVGNKKDGFEL
ncbi:uncharacterized protein PG986_005267 [Apiospora aurea]|uniref:Uncharacterized protein n=1 Tax=Apiospora aurea TaxID=335848 RepID=A0ABR1QH18_9PEZI